MFKLYFFFLLNKGMKLYTCIIYQQISFNVKVSPLLIYFLWILTYPMSDLLPNELSLSNIMQKLLRCIIYRITFLSSNTNTFVHVHHFFFFKQNAYLRKLMACSTYVIGFFPFMHSNIQCPCKQINVNVKF